MKLCLLFILIPFIVFADGESTNVSIRNDDDSRSINKALDVWYSDNTIEAHIRERSHDGYAYLQLIYELAQSTTRLHTNESWGPRSLIADSLAISISRNFVLAHLGRKIDVQALIDRAELNLQTSPLQVYGPMKTDFYMKVMDALTYSSWFTDSFYRRILIWSLKISPQERNRFFRDWIARNSSAELSEFLKNFEKNNQAFIRDFVQKSVDPQMAQSVLKSARIELRAKTCGENFPH